MHNYSHTYQVFNRTKKTFFTSPYNGANVKSFIIYYSFLTLNNNIEYACIYDNTT